MTPTHSRPVRGGGGEVEHIIASSLDHPSVYMGGPSENSRRKARRIVEALASEGYVIATKDPRHDP
jgi:hypothetical protein